MRRQRTPRHPRARRWVAMVGCVGALACAPTVSPPPESGRDKKQALSHADRLMLAVAELDSSEDVLGAVGPAVRRPLEEFLARLGEDDRARLATDVDVAASRPVLHLLAGGKSPAALVALATTSRGTEELVAAARVSSVDLGTLVGPVAETTRRAARATLREYTRRLQLSEVPAEAYEVADAAAAALGRRDLRTLVARARFDKAASPRVRLWLAARLAEELAVEESQEQMSAVIAAAGAESLGPEIAEAGRLAALAEAGRAGLRPDASVEARRAGAVGLLGLGRAHDALRALGKPSGSVPDLSGAALRARALVADSPCPGVPASARHPALCAAAWAGSPAAREAVRLMEASFALGGARPPAAVEAYLGFVHVLPLAHAVTDPPAGAPLGDRLDALDQALSVLTDLTAAQRGLRLFGHVLSAGAEATEHGELAGLPPDARAALERELGALSDSDLADPIAQAAVLAAATVLVWDADVAAVLRRLPARVVPTLLAARAALEALGSLAHGRSTVAASARERLADVMLNESSAVERSRTILFMAEIDAAIEPDDRRVDVLRKVGEQLAVDPASGSVAVRGALVAAGTHARSGDFGEARRLLSSAVAHPPQSVYSWLAAATDSVFAGEAERASAATARGEPPPAPPGDAPPSDESATGAASSLTALVHVEGAPARGAAAAWVRAWAETLSHREALARCGPSPACRRRTERVRQRVDIEALAGSTAHRLLDRGILPVSGIALALDYDPAVGIVPTVHVDLALLPLQLPVDYQRAPEPG